MAHRTPILRYCVIGVAGAAPIAFLTATIFWLLAAFRPHRAPALTQLYNDLAWITFTCGVPFLVALCLFLAVAIYLDEQERPVFAAVGRPLQPLDRHRVGAGGFCRPDAHRALRLERLPVVLGQERRHRRLARRHGGGTWDRRSGAIGWPSRRVGVKRPALLDDPKRELWLAWYATIGFYTLYTVVFFVITRTQPPGKPWYTPEPGGWVVRQPPRGPAHRLWADLHPGRALRHIDRTDHLLHPADVGQPCLCLLVPDPLRRQCGSRVPVHLCGDDGGRLPAGSQPGDPPVAL